MLEYNEIKQGKIIIYEDEPYEILDSHVARTQQRKPQNQVKMRNLINGRAVTLSFHASDKAEEAEINKREIKFLYSTQSRLPAGRQGEYWFSNPRNPRERFKIDEKILGNQAKFFKENIIATAYVWGEDGDEKIISVKLPIKVELKVTEAPPSIKGNTASGGGKPVKLETGAVITAPLFINSGDTLRINTETGEYVERV